MGKRKPKKARRPQGAVKVSKRDRAVWSAAEREAWRLPQVLSVSAWADQHRVLSARTSAEPGQWRTSRTPYLREIMDAFSDPFVEKITMMFATQVGKTEAMLNMLGFCIAEDPAPALWVLPSWPLAKNFSRERLKPALEDCPALRQRFTRVSADVQSIAYHLDRMSLTLGSAAVPGSLSQRPVRDVFLDETDKYPPWSGREASPIKLAQERTKTFWDRKIVESSTPTTEEGYIAGEYERGSREHFQVPCPRCNEFQVLIWPQIKFPEGERDAERMREEKLAWYECVSCGGAITDRYKPKMLDGGVWAPDGADISPDGEVENGGHRWRHRSFHLNSIYSPWLGFSDVAAEFLESRGERPLLMNFTNSWLAEVWRERTEETKEEALYLLALEHPEGLVPRGAQLLTAMVDVQKDCFYLTIRGWGYEEESWLVRAARVETWDDVLRALFHTHYPREDGGEPMEVLLAGIDSAYRTDEVYEVCRAHRDRFRPFKGRDIIPGLPYKRSHIERHPRTNQPIPGGLVLWWINTTWYKDKLARLLHPESGADARWHVFAEPTRDYVRQMTSEVKTEPRTRGGRTKEVWKVKREGMANHYWDCEVGQLALADMLRVSAMRPDGETSVFRPRELARERGRAPDRGGRGGWLGDTKGWLER